MSKLMDNDKTKITLEEYRQQVDGWPESLDRFAEVALKIKDDPQLVDIANNYLTYEKIFFEALEKRNIELG